MPESAGAAHSAPGMKLSLEWLRAYVDYAGSPSELSDLLTFAGIEVEAIATRGADFPKVVVAQILTSRQHPNADRLSVCEVDDGLGQGPRQIVCGAKNYKVGDKVPLALPGAVLPGDFKIKEGKLRGELSAGMLCSGKELGIGEDQSGLLILPADTRVGAPIGEVFPPETVLEIEITPNRPDWLSHVGVAREISALTGAALRPPVVAEVHAQEEAGIRVTIDEDARIGCPFYTATRLDGVKVGPSPDWLRARLEAVGLRPINNIVDVTNYVMMELGQPLHAFDLAKLEGGGIRVRLAEPGETLHALDGRTYALKPHHLVIGDAAGHGSGLAGVMGGEGTGVTETTSSVVLECAYFQPALVRRTARETGLSSDASYRYERGVNAGGVSAAAHRAVALILEIAGGTAHRMVTCGEVDALVAPRIVPLCHERLEALVGIPIEPARVQAILAALGLTQSPEGWSVPSWRRDLEREVDLIEEVTRVVGLEAVPGRALGRMAPSSPVDRSYDFRMELRRSLAALGFHEAITLSLVPARDVAGVEEAAALKNPLSEDQVALRSDLLPGLLQCAARNARSGRSDLRLFELGRIFAKSTPLGEPEALRLTLLMTGAATAPSWRGDGTHQLDLHDLRGILERLLPVGRELEFVRTKRTGLLLAVEVRAGGKPLGNAGQLDPARTRELDLRAPVFAADLDAVAFEALASGDRRFAALPRFPAVTRDIALLVDLAVPHAGLAAAMRAAQEPLLSSLLPFDIFTDPKGERVPAGKKSVAYSLTYRAEEKTLTNDEVNAAHARVKKALGDAVAVQFRE